MPAKSNIKYFKKKDFKLREIASSYKILNYITKDSLKNVSCVIGKAKNHREITKNTKSDRIYYVINGNISVNGRKCGEGQLIYIPKNNEYELKGTFEVLIIDSPGFDTKWDSTKVLKKESK